MTLMIIICSDRKSEAFIGLWFEELTELCQLERNRKTSMFQRMFSLEDVRLAQQAIKVFEDAITARRMRKETRIQRKARIRGPTLLFVKVPKLNPSQLYFTFSRE